MGEICWAHWWLVNIGSGNGRCCMTQAIAWFNVDPGLCHHRASLCTNGLTATNHLDIWEMTKQQSSVFEVSKDAISYQELALSFRSRNYWLSVNGRMIKYHHRFTTEHSQTWHLSQYKVSAISYELGCLPVVDSHYHLKTKSVTDAHRGIFGHEIAYFAHHCHQPWVVRLVGWYILRVCECHIWSCVNFELLISDSVQM